MTTIEWTDETWNPTVGCEIVSPGCTHCYAMRMAARCEAMGIAHYDGTTRKVHGATVWTGQINVAPDHILMKPLTWRRPRKVFVNSMSDLFAEGVPDAVIDRVFAVMAVCPQHIYQVLTKRPARMRQYLTDPVRPARMIYVDIPHPTGLRALADLVDFEIWEKPLPNVWLGTSVEDQRRANERIPDLLATPAAVRFISAEPLLGPIDITCLHSPGDGYLVDAVLGTVHDSATKRWVGSTGKLHWLIAGGESGPHARPMHPDWVRQLRDTCAGYPRLSRALGVAFFFKQWGVWKEAFHDEDGPRVSDVECGTEEATALRCAVGRHCWVSPEGRVFRREGDIKDAARLMVAIAKHAPGFDLLDGRQHKAFPEIRA